MPKPTWKAKGILGRSPGPPIYRKLTGIKRVPVTAELERIQSPSRQPWSKEVTREQTIKIHFGSISVVLVAVVAVAVNSLLQSLKATKQSKQKVPAQPQFPGIWARSSALRGYGLSKPRQHLETSLKTHSFQWTSSVGWRNWRRKMLWRRWFVEFICIRFSSATRIVDPNPPKLTGLVHKGGIRGFGHCQLLKTHWHGAFSMFGKDTRYINSEYIHSCGSLPGSFSVWLWTEYTDLACLRIPNCT